MKTVDSSHKFISEIFGFFWVLTAIVEASTTMRCRQTMRLHCYFFLFFFSVFVSIVLVAFSPILQVFILDYHSEGLAVVDELPTKCLGKLSCQPLFSVSNACKPSTTYFFLKFLRLVFLLNQFLMADKTMSTPLQFLYFYFFKFHK